MMCDLASVVSDGGSSEEAVVPESVLSEPASVVTAPAEPRASTAAMIKDNMSIVIFLPSSNVNRHS
jgi:hypothetical protein